MSTVRHDSFSRGTLRRRGGAVSGLHFFLMFVAAGLLVLSRVEHPLVMQFQASARQMAQPTFGWLGQLAQPMRRFQQSFSRYFILDSEIQRLERELATLRQLLDQRSDLAKRNVELGRLVNLVRRAPVKGVTVEVIAGPRGLFGKSVTIGAGQADGLIYGQPVFNADGLFGRVVSVAEKSAKVLQLNDINSRIAVVVGPAHHQALLVGDNAQWPRLIYLGSVAGVKAGDEVVTSGASGEFPRGIVVGKVSVVNGDFRVKTKASLLAGAYLTVLRYELQTTGGRSAAAPVLSNKLQGGGDLLAAGARREAGR